MLKSPRIADPAAKGVHRQRHVNADGREVFLYSYSDEPRVPSGEALAREPQSAELRWHPLRQEWNVYAAARQNRTFKPGAVDDPLAPTREGGPPTEIPFADFEVAVFENRFPALSLDAAARAHPHATSEAATGRCEVVVYGPESEGDLGSLSSDRRRLLCAAWNDRYRELFAMGLDYVLPFENRGEAVGVTLHHPHGQIYAFARTPAIQARSTQAFEAGFDLAAAMSDWRDDYWIEAAGGLAQFAPPFARFPYETWIAPVAARRGPWEFTAEEADAFAHLLGAATRRYDAFFGRATPYMLSLHAAPRNAGAGFHFTAQFYPILRAPDRLKYLASVEQATAVFTVDVGPEAAASALRGVVA